MTDDRKESKLEVAKRTSRYLRGGIEQTLQSGASHFDGDDAQLLKFHGTYQQDDRDARRARRAQGLEKDYQFMVRVAIPAGALTGDQYLVLDDLADRFGRGSLRVTTRQGFQFHGVTKDNLKPTIAEINQTLLTTLAACGDVQRNVMASPAPFVSTPYQTVRRVAREIALAFRPRSNAYHEIWLDGQRVDPATESEPLYGAQYLPRKFKTGVTVPHDNAIDIYSYDLGLIALFDDHEQLEGFNVLVGGGMGMTHKKPDTFAKLAEPLGFVGPHSALDTVRTAITLFRDHGNRADRRHARLKYLITEWGMDRFKSEFQSRAPMPVLPWRPLEAPGYDDYLGPHQQGDGRLFYGLYIENGRIVDRDVVRIKTALRTIVQTLHCNLTLTPNQNVLLRDLQPDAVARLESILDDHKVPRHDTLSAARRYAMACPALPTCGLAITESERIMPSVLDRLEQQLARMGVSDVPLTIRMTGCPNGCARPYTADIAFVGRAADLYNIHVGGGLSGDRMADCYADDVHTDDLIATLRPLLEAWATHRHDGEGLGDFYQRIMQTTRPRIVITGRENPTRSIVELKVLNR